MLLFVTAPRAFGGLAEDLGWCQMWEMSTEYIFSSPNSCGKLFCSISKMSQ